MVVNQRESIAQAKRDLSRAQAELVRMRSEGNARFKELHLSFTLIAHPDVIAEDFDDKLLYQAEWELTRSYKLRECMLTKDTIVMFTQAYKGVVKASGKQRTFWVSKHEFLLRSLKKPYTSKEL